MDFDCTAWVLVAINHSYTLLGFCIGCTSLGFGLAALWPQDCVGYALLVLILVRFLGFWMAQLWLWLLVGYEHNVLEQGLMEIYGVWGRRLAGDFMVSLAGILRLSP